MKEGITIGLLCAFTISFIVAMMIDSCGGWPESYKKGQIDAINGAVKYELVTQPDSTRTWEYIK